MRAAGGCAAWDGNGSAAVCGTGPRRGASLHDGGGVHPYPFGDDALRVGGRGYESLFRLSLCEVGVDVVEDVGRVRIGVAAFEGFCPVIWCVAGVVERIVEVLVLACSAWFVHAVMDCDSCWVGAGHVGVVVNSHWDLWSGFHATVGFSSAQWNHGATHA